jgi:hypothetical protein
LCMTEPTRSTESVRNPPERAAHQAGAPDRRRRVAPQASPPGQRRRPPGRGDCRAGRSALPPAAVGAARADRDHYVGGHRRGLASVGGQARRRGPVSRGRPRGKGRAAQPVRPGFRRLGEPELGPGGDRVRRREHQRRGRRAGGLRRGGRPGRPGGVPGGEHPRLALDARAFLTAVCR